MLGASIPPLPHAISVSLPTWRDNVDYEEGAKRVIDAMSNGYPRFFIHFSIQKLAGICEAQFTQSGEQAMLFPSQRAADECRAFMLRRGTVQELPPNSSMRTVRLAIHSDHHITHSPLDHLDALYIVFFPSVAYLLARQFWQHTGLGISSRFADYCLDSLGSPTSLSHTTVQRCSKHSKGGNKHYAKKHSLSPIISTHDSRRSDMPDSSLGTYVEERYGRNMPLSFGSFAKRSMRRRIAGVLAHDPFDSLSNISVDSGRPEEIGPSCRGVRTLTEDDVYLFPTGMTAIWTAHQTVLATMPIEAKSVCFGFPYTDTLKILQKWGPGCYHYGRGDMADLQALEQFLTASPPNTVSALFCEFPSNPLLRSPPLVEIRRLADRFDFLIIVDDTVGNFTNVQVLPHADIVCTSLSKIFSGDANVLGGSLVLNPDRKHYPTLQNSLVQHYEDLYFSEDAIFMERNSRDFAHRVRIIDANAKFVAEYLREHSQDVDQHSRLKRVCYPKWETSENYESCRIKGTDGNMEHGGGYGGLLSVTFTDQTASQAFFDALECNKGPSLGTNFTLACPYTIIAHYTELEWANDWGVESALVRISIGLESEEELLAIFRKAVDAANGAL